MGIKVNNLYYYFKIIVENYVKCGKIIIVKILTNLKGCLL